MKKFLLHTIVIFFNISLSSLYASDFWMYHDLKKFPKQPYFEDISTQTFIPPEARDSLGIGGVQTQFYRNFTDILSLKELEAYYGPVFKMDLPFHSRGNSIGLDLKVFLGFSGAHLLSISKKNQFDTKAHGLEVLVLPDTRKWTYQALGDWTFLVSPKIGVLGLIDTRSVAGVLGLGIGINWYPWEWLGFFAEANSTCNYMLITEQTKNLFYSTSFTVGARTSC